MMKTVKIISLVLFAAIISILFAVGTGLPLLGIAAFVLPGLYLAARFTPRGSLGFDLMSMDDDAPVDNMAGIASFGYVALANDIDVWPTIPDPSDTGMDQVQELKGELTMKSGKTFFKFKMEADKCSIESSDVGAKGSICQKYTLKFFRGDMASKIRGFVRATNNQELVFAIPDAQGRINFIGSEAYPARKVPEGSATTGEGPEGESGVSMTFVSYGTGPVPILVDEITIPLPEES
jgi:hypothetical protein